jgi:SlyX protein
MNSADSSNRIDQLEIRIAYQDQVIDDLNKAVTEQWKQIDVLTKQVSILLQRIQEVEGQTGAPSGPEAPPPHY